MALWNKFVLNTHALRIWVVHLLVYSASSQQVEHCLGSAGEHLTELYKYLENTAKKRIEFLIHKSWQIEQVIGKVSFWTDSSAFCYHVFYKQTSAFMSNPPPLSVGDFSRVLSGSTKSSLLLLNRHKQKHTLWYPGYLPSHLSW